MSLMSDFQKSERWKSNAILNTRLTNFKEADYKSDFYSDMQTFSSHDI